jgi:hypothetical protein
MNDRKLQVDPFNTSLPLCPRCVKRQIFRLDNLVVNCRIDEKNCRLVNAAGFMASQRLTS